MVPPSMHPQEILLITGLLRSGTSLMMRMLPASGIHSARHHRRSDSIALRNSRMSASSRGASSPIHICAPTGS